MLNSSFYAQIIRSSSPIIALPVRQDESFRPEIGWTTTGWPSLYCSSPITGTDLFTTGVNNVATFSNVCLEAWSPSNQRGRIPSRAQTQRRHTQHRVGHSFQFWFYQATSNILKLGTELLPETSENRHIFTRLSARENYTGFSTILIMLHKTLICAWPGISFKLLRWHHTTETYSPPSLFLI